jgi:hypothetical protein
LNEARTTDVERLCQLLAVPATDYPQLVATVCCERAMQLGDSNPEWRSRSWRAKNWELVGPEGPPPTAEGIAFDAGGGTAAIVAAMSNHRAVVDLQIAACQALCVLTRAKECQDTVLAAGGAEAVVGALQAHIGVAKVQEEGCKAICNLVFRSDEGKAAVLAAGGAEAVVGALQAHVGVVTVQEEGCWVVQNLTATNDEGRAAVVAAGGVEAVVGALRAHPAEARMQRYGCSAAFNLSVSGSGKAQLRAAGAQQLARLAARNHPNHAGVQEKSAKLLGQL